MLPIPRLKKPQYPASLVDRPRLYQRLDGWQAVRGVLIHAPAGYGKSTLVSRWIDMCDHREHSAWVALDDNDNNPRHFLRHLAAALDQVIPGAVASVEPILHDSQSPADRALLRLFSLFAGAAEASAVARQQPALVVLDDLHCIDDADVQALIATCLEQGPEGLHLMLLARKRPDVPLARLYAHAKIDVVSAEDLRFTEEEVRTYLLSQGFADPAAADVRQLAVRSEGWATALHLAVLASPKRTDLHDLLTALHGANNWLADFLADEVLNQQAPELRRFLLQTSLLDIFNAELCVAVTGMDDAYARLVEIARAELFLIQVDSRGWFRYHHLFQELLQHRLQAQWPAAAVADLHRRAAAWLASDGQVRSAVQHLLAAGSGLDAAALVERWLRPAIASDLYQAQALLALVPHNVIVQRPRLMLDRCLVAVMFDDKRVLAYAREAESTILEQELPEPAAARFQAELLVLRAIGYFLQRDLDAASGDAQQALEYLSYLDDFHCGSLHLLNMHLQRYQGRSRESLQSAAAAQAAFSRAGIGSLNVAVRREVARWHMLAGNSAEATRLFEQLFNDWKHEQLSVARELFSAYCHAAENSYWQNELERAQAYQQVALALAQALQDQDLVRAACYLGKIMRTDLQAKDAPADAPPDVGGQATRTRAREMALIYKTYYLVTAGRHDAAWQSVQQAGVHLEMIWNSQIHQGLIAFLRAYIAHGVDLDAVTPALAKALADATRAGSRLQQLQILALVAWQQVQLDGAEAARPALAQAASLASETGYVRVLPDIATLVPLLGDLEAVQETPPRVGAPVRQDGVATVGEGAVLTAQEKSVLRLLAAEYTYAQIAGELVISLNTVRTHVSSVYRKLGVQRRDQAVAAAQQSGYLAA